MTEQSRDSDLRAVPITLDELRHKALRIRGEVVDEAKAAVTARGTQIVVVGVIAVLAAVSVAYLVGSMSARRAVEPPHGY